VRARTKKEDEKAKEREKSDGEREEKGIRNK